MSGPTSAPEALLRRLEWTVIRRLDGLLQGSYRTLFRGVGLDLADLREYQHDDDVRYIDWNVTARLQAPYVREYNEDREISAWFLIDTSASMAFGSRASDKESVAEGFVAVLARLLTRHGNRVGAILFDQGIDAVIPARGGRRHVLHILSALGAVQRPASGQATDLARLLLASGRLVRRRSMVFVLSDFISPPGWSRPLRELARRHDVLAVRLYDPLESEIPDLGLVVVQDAETGEQMMVDTGERGFRRRFAEAAKRREEALFQGLREAGVDALELSTDDDLFDAILRYAELRRRRGLLAAGAARPRSRGNTGEVSVA